MGLKHSRNFREKIRDMDNSHGIDLLKITSFREDYFAFFFGILLICFGLIAPVSSSTKTWSKTRGNLYIVWESFLRLFNPFISSFFSYCLCKKEKGIIEIILGYCWPDESWLSWSSNSSASTSKVFPRARPRILRWGERKQCRVMKLHFYLLTKKLMDASRQNHEEVAPYHRVLDFFF